VGSINTGIEHKIMEIHQGSTDTRLYVDDEIKIFPNLILSRFSRLWMVILLAVSDLSCLLFAGILAVVFRILLPAGLHNPPFYLNLIPLTFFFLSIYAWWGLYPGVGLSPVEELRRLFLSTSLVFLLITAFTFWVRSAEYYSRLIFIFTWFFARFGKIGRIPSFTQNLLE
jgi:hypothetical protein